MKPTNPTQNYKNTSTLYYVTDKDRKESRSAPKKEKMTTMQKMTYVLNNRKEKIEGYRRNRNRRSRIHANSLLVQDKNKVFLKGSKKKKNPGTKNSK